MGVRGLRGGRAGGAASNRRTALVEHAVATLMVTAEDLPMLDQEHADNEAAARGTGARTTGTTAVGDGGRADAGNGRG